MSQASSAQIGSQSHQPKLATLMSRPGFPTWPQTASDSSSNAPRLVIYEYQEEYSFKNKFHDPWLKDQIREQNPDANVKKEIAKISDRRMTFVMGLVYRLGTWFAGFRHVRLLVLDWDTEGSIWTGKAYGFTVGDEEHGVFGEEGTKWNYDDKSAYLAEGFTFKLDEEILEIGMCLA